MMWWMGPRHTGMMMYSQGVMNASVLQVRVGLCFGVARRC
jgi:hypothetical protein